MARGEWTADRFRIPCPKGKVGNALFLLTGDAVSTAVATGTVVAGLTIPARTTVLQVIVEIVVANGKTSTATVGDGTTADGWDAEANMNATAGTRTSSIVGTDAYAVGKYYAVEDTIDLTITVAAGPATTGSVKVSAICARVA